MVNADHLYAADAHWWHYHIHDINMGFSGNRWSCEPTYEEGAKPSNWNSADPVEWGVTVLECKQDKGLSTNNDSVHSGGNSGYQAINLAYHLGATRIILLGFDMHCTGGKSHFFGDHPSKFISNNKYERFIAAFRTIKPERYGLEIFNCSRQTALDAFVRVDLGDMF